LKIDFEVDVKDQEKLNKKFKTSSDTKKSGKNVKCDDDNEDELPTGRKTTKQLRNEDEEVTDVEASDEEVAIVQEDKKIVSFAKDILTLVVPLICILTLKDEEYNILYMLKNIRDSVLSVKTEIIYKVFKEQSLIWWSNENAIDYIIKIIENEKYTEKISIISNIALQFKMSMKNLIDRPKELLELIESCLKPKQKEKQENGEVFTPMWIVFEMLDRLDKHYIEENGRSIFSVPNLKWFDPASGMGNFPIGVYMRLMVGLEKEFSDAEERKKHIIENMLYMSELNAKNVFICREIFNGDKYSMNIHEGDTLKINDDKINEDKITVSKITESKMNEKWIVAFKNGFDVVLGNPPFNKGGIKSCRGDKTVKGTETIWPEFIENSFKKWLKPSGYLVFITPLSWLKKSHSMHTMMLDNHIVWLKLWDTSKSKEKINAEIPISFYVLQNRLNIEKNKTILISEILRSKTTTASTGYLNPDYTIPLAFHSIFSKLSMYIEEQDCKLVYKTKTVVSDGLKIALPSSYTVDDKWAVDTYLANGGVRVKKAFEKHPDAEKRKIIIANKSTFDGSFIDEGKLSLTGNHKFYILGDDLELIKKILDFKIIDIINRYTKYGQNFLDNSAFTYIPDLRKVKGITVDNITEEEFYGLIGLTIQEIEMIRNSKQ
jgi:hypothetical protein